MIAKLDPQRLHVGRWSAGTNAAPSGSESAKLHDHGRGDASEAVANRESCHRTGPLASSVRSRVEGPLKIKEPDRGRNG
jgi:hypothetical protein